MPARLPDLHTPDHSYDQGSVHFLCHSWWRLRKKSKLASMRAGEKQAGKVHFLGHKLSFLALTIAQWRHEGAWRCGLAESRAWRRPYGQFQSRISLERLIPRTSDFHHSTQRLELYKPWSFVKIVNFPFKVAWLMTIAKKYSKQKFPITIFVRTGGTLLQPVRRHPCLFILQK